MCGPAINWLHSLLIGPVIIISAYYNWKIPLYILGGSAILVHGFYMNQGTSTAKLMRDTNKKYLFATPGSIEPDRAFQGMQGSSMI